MQDTMGTTLTKSEILELENTLYKAIKNSDVNALEKLLHGDLLFVLPDGRVITKEDDLNTYRSGKIRFDELSPAIDNLNIIGDVAVVTLTMKLKGSFDNAPFEVAYRYIRFWKRFPEGMKVIGGSGSVI